MVEWLTVEWLTVEISRNPYERLDIKGVVGPGDGGMGALERGWGPGEWPTCLLTGSI